MTEHIEIREKNESDDVQIKEILDECFGQNRHNRTVYLYRKIPPLKHLSLVSCKKNDPSIVIGTISFYPVLVNEIKCLLLGPLAVKLNYQGQGFGKLLVEKGIDLAISKGEKICFVSGDYKYYKDFGFYKLDDKNLNIKTLGPLSFDHLLICELKKGALNLLQNNSEILPMD